MLCASPPTARPTCGNKDVPQKRRSRARTVGGVCGQCWCRAGPYIHAGRPPITVAVPRRCGILRTRAWLPFGMAASTIAHVSVARTPSVPSSTSSFSFNSPLQ